MRLASILILVCCLVACSSPTPVTEIDAAPLVYQDGDLLAGYRPGPSLPRKPLALDATPSATPVATLTFKRSGIDIGMATVLVYDSNAKAEQAFAVVRDGFKGAAIADLGDQAAGATWEAVVTKELVEVHDLVVLRCRSVTHMRFMSEHMGMNGMQPYAKKIDERIQRLGC